MSDGNQGSSVSAGESLTGLTVQPKNEFVDLSGIDSSSYANPYDALILACHNKPFEIQARYDTHRTTRQKQQDAILLNPEFTSKGGLNLDTILQRLEDPTLEPGFKDPRHSLVFWARPSPMVKKLITEIQKRLKDAAPHLWLMPTDRQHLTVLEVAHSLPEGDIAKITEALKPAIESMSKLSGGRLIKPMLGHDRTAVAISFVPAAGESLLAVEPSEKNEGADLFTYHHLRRAVYGYSMTTSVKIQSRYIVPSAHITIGRFLTQEDHDTLEKMNGWIQTIDGINQWLRQEYWPKEGQKINDGGEWEVGQDGGLICRDGMLWYGGGQTVKFDIEGGRLHDEL